MTAGPATLPISEPTTPVAGPRLRPRLVIISGAPGAGKTTLARTLALRLRVPLLVKDDLKEAIADEIGPPADVPASQRLGLAAYRVLYDVAQTLATAGVDLIIESNFRRGLSEPDLEPLVLAADCRLLHCTASPVTVRNRYSERFRRGERHPAHLDSARADALAADLEAGRFEPLELGVPTLVVRTDDGYEPRLTEILAFVAPSPE